jgi:DNA-binding transcriptional LysR family regulator
MTFVSFSRFERFDELRLFVEVAEAGSLTAAAGRLGLPKSTVGRAIGRLERELGVALVRRLPRGAELTEHGRQLRDLALPHVTGLRDVALALGSGSLEPYGALRITAPVDIGQLVLGRLLPRFIELYPKVALEVDLTTRFVDVLGEGFDVALRVSSRPLPPSSLRVRKIAGVVVELYAAPDYARRHRLPERPEQLGAHEHVLFQAVRGRSRILLEGRGRAREVAVVGRVGANDFFFVREAIVAGAGIGPLPWFVARSEIEAGRLVRVLPGYRLPGATLYWLQAPVRPVPRKLEALRDFLLERAPELLESG